MISLRDGRAAQRRWVARVKTESTYAPAGLFTNDAATIARTLERVRRARERRERSASRA